MLLKRGVSLLFTTTRSNFRSHRHQARFFSRFISRMVCVSVGSESNAFIRRLPLRRRHLLIKPLVSQMRCTSTASRPPKSDKDRASSRITSSQPDPTRFSETSTELRESPYTLPNAITIARIFACPFLGYSIIHGDFALATGILFISGVSDWLDGWLARRYGSQSVLGSILDPTADKALMTTLVVTLAYTSLLPLPLAALILGRDVALSLSAFYFRYISLPRPRTFMRYFDPSIPSAEVKPTQISKVNTTLQLLLMGITTISPLLSFSLASSLPYLQWTVAGTTIWSGLSYINHAGVKILTRNSKFR